MEAPRMRREDLQTLWQRLLRVARLDATAFLEVRNDPTATVPAFIVVVVASFLSGLGGWLFYISGTPSFARDSSQFFVRSVIVGTIFAVVLWSVWVAVTVFMLQQVWRRRVAFLPLVRTMGLAYFPVALSVLMVIRWVATPVAVISLAAAVLLSGVAVEAATEAEPSEVLLANLAGFAVFAIVLGLLGRDGNLYAPGLFPYSL
jgi:hypothetical protein